MSRLIDTDSMSKRDGEDIRLIDTNAIDYNDYWWHKGYSARDCQQAAKLISEQPTVQAIPIKWLTEQADSPSNSDELRNAIDYIVYTLWAERREPNTHER